MSTRCQNVKKMSNCQKDVKLTNVKKVKSLDYEGGSQKIINWHNKVYRYWCQVWRQIWRSPKLSRNTFYAHFEGIWLPSYVISKLASICVNLIMSIYFLWTSHSPGIWFFDNRHLFDNLTLFDILLPNHLCAPLLMGTGWWGIWAMWHVPLLDLHGGTVMGYMSNRAHGQWAHEHKGQGDGNRGDGAHCHNNP